MENVGEINDAPIIVLLAFNKEYASSFDCIPETMNQLCQVENKCQCGIKLHKAWRSFNYWGRTAEVCNCFKRNLNE